MSLKQTVYCYKCEEVNLVPAKTGKDFFCVRCGQRLENPLEPERRRPRPERRSLKFASVLLNAVVAVAACFYVLVVHQKRVAIASDPDVRVFRGAKLSQGSRLASREGTITGHPSVIDGDTIEIRGTRVRLWGIDAPEGAQSCTKGGTSWRCGTDSAKALAGFLSGKTVTCYNKKDRDRYGSTMAVCKTGGEDIGTEQVRNGWALDDTRYSRGAYASEQRYAESQKLGVWQGEFEPPWEWTRR